MFWASCSPTLPTVGAASRRPSGHITHNPHRFPCDLGSNSAVAAAHGPKRHARPPPPRPPHETSEKKYILENRCPDVTYRAGKATNNQGTWGKRGSPAGAFPQGVHWRIALAGPLPVHFRVLQYFLEKACNISPRRVPWTGRPGRTAWPDQPAGWPASWAGSGTGRPIGQKRKTRK